MTQIITARYTSQDTVRNVYDDLISTGIPDEKIRTEKNSPVVHVMSPETTAPEVIEILNRHEPAELSI
jgi:hypothetical protein